jgi:hypothetical protein
VRIERKSDQGERGNPLVADRLAQRDVRAERPSADEDRAGRLVADPSDRRRDVMGLGPAAPVRPARAHDAAEVEAQDHEAARGELGANGPQDRVVLAAAVPRMRMAHDGSGHRLAAGEPKVPLERHAIVGREPDRGHVRRW